MSGKHTLLVVEDNTITRRMFRVALETQGWSVVEAPDGAAALAAVAARLPDLVVQDLTLPDMDGLELKRRLTAACDGREVPVVATSGFLSKLEQARTLSLGFAEHLFKPVDPFRLIEVVRALLAHRIGAGPGRGRRVVVVDDDPVQCRLLKLQLEHAGFLARMASGAEEALELVAEERPDAVVSDVLMGGLDGFQLCLRLRSDPALAAMPVVLVSVAFTEEADAELARRVGASALLARTPEHAGVADALALALRDAPPPVDGSVSLANDDYAQRMVRQLERQVGHNAELAGRLALHEAAMGVLARLGETARTPGSLEQLVPDLLQYALDAAGISIGAVFLLGEAERPEADDEFVLRACHGFTNGARGEAERFFGRRDLLALASRGHDPLNVPGRPVEAAWETELLEAAGARSMLLVPLRLGAQRLGVLVLAAARRRMVGEWLPFAEAIGVHIAQAVALARAVRQIASEQERFRQLADSMPQMVYTAAGDGRIDYRNERWQAFTGIRGPAQPEQASEALHPDDRSRVLGAWREAIATGRPFALEYRMRDARDGVYRWLLGRTVPVRDAEGRVTRWFGTATDIDDHKRTEVELRVSEARLRIITENMQEVFWSAGPRLERTLYVSPAYEALFGRSRESLYADATSWHAAIHPEDRERVVASIAAAVQANAAFDVRFRLVRAAGDERCVHSRGFPVSDPGAPDTAYVGTILDETDLSRAHAREATLEAQLRRSQKMEAVGRLAGGVSHDFNNLLTAILGYSELLLERLDRRDPLRGHVEEIRKAGDRAASLTRQLLVFSRHEAITPQVLDPNAVVVEMEKLVRRLIGEDLELVVELAPDVGRVKIDKGYLEQVLLNLCVNARDAMPKGGRLTVRTTPALHPARGPEVVLSVADSGCGMPPEVVAHLFEPFFTTKEAGKGTGLGLSTVYGIVEGAGGDIDVETLVGRGTTFRVHLPRVEERPTPAAPPSPAATPRGGETVLLVEDDEMVRALSRAVLENGGYTVLEAANAGEALLLCERGEPIDLLFTDVVMPGLSGPDLVKRLQTIRPGLTVLYASGYTSGALPHTEALASGAAFIQKPFTPRSLAQKVREVLDAR